MSAPNETVLVDERDDRLHVRLDRPESRNALDAAMVRELHRVCEKLEDRPRFLVLTASGGTFAVGADIGQLLQRRDDALRGIHSRLFERIRRLPLAAVAAVEGWALGGGAELAYALRDPHRGSYRGVRQPRAGPGRPGRGRRLLAAGRADRRVGREAGAAPPGGPWTRPPYSLRAWSSMSFPREELLGRADELVDRVAESSSAALRLPKIVMDTSGAHPVADDLAQVVLFESRDKHRRMTDFLEKRSTYART